ncbi:MAG: SgcJ/EcaC family oxidoreductase [Actinobacteria bacterium]|nr:SgcJ/EcaC family oxidoreductase [Actinomycetota bacterium]
MRQDSSNDPAIDSTALEEITEVVATVERTQREESVDEFVALFREDAVWTTARGLVLTGRDEIAAFTARALPGSMQGLGGTTYEVSDVLFIRADVAAVKVRQVYASDAGVPIEADGEGSPLYVMSREAGRWLLTACQNTPVAA